MAFRSGILRRQPFPIVGFRLRYLFCRGPSFSLAVVIKEKIVQDLCQPRFHIGSGIELIVSREGTNKSLLDQILGLRRIFCQMDCDPIQMIEVSHSFACNNAPLAASCFSLPLHAGILTNSKAAV